MLFTHASRSPSCSFFRWVVGVRGPVDGLRVALVLDATVGDPAKDAARDIEKNLTWPKFPNLT